MITVGKDPLAKKVWLKLDYLEIQNNWKKFYKIKQEINLNW